MYLYAVSLGANIASHYLINDDANNPFSGAVTYAAGMNVAMCSQSFQETLWGLYDWALGYDRNLKFRKRLPEL